jgi:hypothetical protein
MDGQAAVILAVDGVRRSKLGDEILRRCLAQGDQRGSAGLAKELDPALCMYLDQLDLVGDTILGPSSEK